MIIGPFITSEAVLTVPKHPGRSSLICSEALCPEKFPSSQEGIFSQRKRIDVKIFDGHVLKYHFNEVQVYFDYLYVHKSTLLGNKAFKISLLKRQMGSRLTTSINFDLTRDKTRVIIFHDFRRQVQKPKIFLLSKMTGDQVSAKSGLAHRVIQGSAYFIIANPVDSSRTIYRPRSGSNL